jgi:hypothetical protein
MTLMTHTPALLAAETTIATNTYDEACRVTEAYLIQLRKRKQTPHSDAAEARRRIEECQAQLEAAERAEYAAWLQLEQLRKMALSNRPGKR